MKTIGSSGLSYTLISDSSLRNLVRIILEAFRKVHSFGKNASGCGISKVSSKVDPPWQTNSSIIGVRLKTEGVENGKDFSYLSISVSKQRSWMCSVGCWFFRKKGSKSRRAVEGLALGPKKAFFHKGPDHSVS